MFGQSNYFRKVHKISHLILYIFRIVILIHNSYNLEIKKQNGDSYSLKQFFGLLIVFFTLHQYFYDKRDNDRNKCNYSSY